MSQGQSLNSAGPNATNNHALKRLADIAHIFIGPPTPSRAQREGDFRHVRSVLRVEGPIAVRVLRMRAIEQSFINVEEADTFFVTNEESAAEYLVRPGDLLVQARSTTLNMGIAPNGLTRTIVNNHIIVIRSKKLLPRLLAAHLRHPAGNAALRALSQSTTLQMNLTIKQIGNLRTPVPPLATQEKLAALLEAAESQHQAATEAADLRRSVAELIATEILFKGEIAI